MSNYLADTSAIVRIINGTAHQGWTDLAAAGHIAVCPPVETEIAFTARDWRTYQELQTYLRATFTWLPVPDAAWLMVAEIQRDLVKIGHHRGPSTADLLVAATALDSDHPVVHLDLDFEAIGKVAPLRAVRIDQAPPG